MAHALQIDTLAFTKKLREAGAEEGLAEAIVEGLTAADTSELATKGDIAEVKAELKTDIAGLDVKIAEVRTEIAGLDAKIDKVASGLDVKIAEVKTEIAEVKTEIAEVKGELKTEIAQSTNKTIYTLGGIIGVLFVLDRLVPLLGVSG